jgi:hypothetical protein
MVGDSGEELTLRLERGSSTNYPDDPSPEFAEYFDKESALIVTVPTWHWDIHPDEFAAQIKPLVEEALRDADAGSDLRVRVQPYQIGSSAEWSRTLAVVIENALPAVSFIANLVAIAPFAVKIAQKLRGHNNAQLAEQADADTGLHLRVPTSKLGLPIVIGPTGMHYQATYGSLDTAVIT